jgi:hypothetical protein
MDLARTTSDCRTGGPHRALLAPGVRRFALVVLVASFVIPPTGLGVDLCPLHRVTGLPCPGCGMTRGLAALTQGDFTAAAGLNPFALLVWPVLVALAVLALVPQRLVGRLERRLDAHGSVLTRMFHLGLATLLGFGALRVVLLVACGERFP